MIVLDNRDDSIYSLILERLEKIETAIKNPYRRSDSGTLLNDMMNNLSSKVDKIDQKIDNLNNDVTTIKIDVGALKNYQSEAIRRAADNTAKTRWYYGIVVGLVAVAVGIAKLFY